MPLDPYAYVNTYDKAMRLPGDLAAQQQSTIASQQEQQRAQEMQPYKMKGAQTEIDANKIKIAKDKLDFSLQTLQGVNDQASYDRWHQQMRANGIDTTGDPLQFDPMWKQQSLEAGLSMHDKLTKFQAVTTSTLNPETGAYETNVMTFNPATGQFAPSNMAPQSSIVGKTGAATSTPMAQKEWEFYKNLSPAEQEQFLGMKRANQVVNLGGTAELIGPTGATVKSYQKTAPPQLSLEQLLGADQGAPIGGEGLTGEEYLATLPPAMQPVVKAMAEGRMAYPTARSPSGLKLIAAAQQYAPTSSGNAFLNIRKFDTGVQGNTVRSFNVVTAHLSTLDKLVDALDNNDIKALNAAANAYKEQTGNPAPTNFNTAKSIVADELTKAIVGSGSGALGDRQTMAMTINAANSPKQLKEAIATYKELAKGQLEGLQKQYEASTGLTNFEEKYLSKETRKEFRSPVAGENVPEGVDPRLWEHMTEEERALFR